MSVARRTLHELHAARGSCGHLEHIEPAFRTLLEAGIGQGTRETADALREHAAAACQAERFHVTLTPGPAPGPGGP